MIALDAALRRLTVCELTRESRGNGGGFRPRVWLRLRAAAGGNWPPVGRDDAPEPEIAHWLLVNRKRGRAVSCTCSGESIFLATHPFLRT
jgi:hypothetical protein